MKCNSLVINGIVTLLAVLTVLSFSSCDNASKEKADKGSETATEGEANNVNLPIAYVNIDSLLINYDYAKDVNEKLNKKAEDIRLKINQMQKKLESDMTEFQRKIQNNAFLSEERAQQEYARLQKQEMDLQTSAQKLQNEWGMEQQKENMQIADSVRNAVKILNAKDKKYQMIFNMRELDNIIMADPKYDITQDILLLLNTRYKAATKK